MSKLVGANGGRIEFLGDLNVNQNNAQNGRDDIFLTGASLLTAANLTLGNATGAGAVTLSEGSRLFTNDITAAESLASQLILTGQSVGAGLNLLIRGVPQGSAGSTRVAVLEGSELYARRDVFVGEAGRRARVEVVGHGSLLDAAGEVSIDGAGELLLSSGALNAAGLNLGDHGNLQVIGASSLLRVEGDIRLHGNGALSLRDGTVDVDGIRIFDQGRVDFEGGKLSFGLYTGDLTNNAGAVSPGIDEARGSTIVGDYNQGPGGVLELEVGGLLPASGHDLLNVTGAALVDGVLSLRVIDGFTPTTDDEFLVFNATMLAGFFDNVTTGLRIQTSDGRGSFMVNYGVGSAFDPSQIWLSDFIANPLAGDFNADGVVNAVDYAVWREELGEIYSEPDYDVWVANYGATTPAVASTVPEPSCVWLSFLALVARWKQLRR